jgi:lactobin A/cerein 7B family class IIb bacteriocin
MVKSTGAGTQTQNEMHELDTQDLDEVSGRGLIGVVVRGVVGGLVGGAAGAYATRGSNAGERIAVTAYAMYEGAVGGALIGGFATGVF